MNVFALNIGIVLSMIQQLISDPGRCSIQDLLVFFVCSPAVALYKHADFYILLYVYISIQRDHLNLQLKIASVFGTTTF